MAISPVVSSLNTYIEEHRLPLISALNLGGNTLPHATLESGVRYKEALNQLSTAVQFSDSKVCGFDALSQQTLSQRILTVNNIRVEESFCVRQLIKYWMNYEVRANAAGGEDLPFAADFMDQLTKHVNELTDYWIWQGNTTAGSTYVSQTDGLIKLMSDDSSVVDVAIASGTSKYAAIKQMLAAIPSAVLQDEVAIFADPAFVSAYKQELLDLNLYHVMPNEDFKEIQIPASSVKLVATVGMTGSNKLVAIGKSNLFYGMDGQGDMDDIQSWYSADTDTVRVRICFNAGAQYGFGSEVVLGALA